MDAQSAQASSQPSDEGSISPAPSLTYEETPVIEPLSKESSPPVPPEPPPSLPEEASPIPVPLAARKSFGGAVSMTVFFIVLFVAGVGLSVVMRQYLASRLETPPPAAAPAAFRPTPTTTPLPLITAFVTPTASPPAILLANAGWKTVQVVSGITQKPLSGVTFRLPGETPVPVCDGGNCASQGTYLPGGSRFTVAPRGQGQLLMDARGNVGLTDAAGKTFMIKQVILDEGRKALEYTGDFQGSTVGGYTFTRMHGFMIEIDEGITLEMNHFSPAGKEAGFVADEVVFGSIIKSLTVDLYPKSPLTPTPTRFATPATSPTATLQPTP